MTDRRDPSEKDKLISTYVRLLVEVVAIVWAVSGLNATTVALREGQAEMRAAIVDNAKAINDLRVDVMTIRQTKKDK